MRRTQAQAAATARAAMEAGRSDRHAIAAGETDGGARPDAESERAIAPGQPVWTPDDPALVASRAFLAHRGVTAGPTGYIAEQLCVELGRRQWLWRLNVGDRSVVAGEYADATKYDLPPATSACTIAHKGATAVVALTMVLAEAMRSDDLTTMGRRD